MNLSELWWAMYLEGMACEYWLMAEALDHMRRKYVCNEARRVELNSEDRGFDGEGIEHAQAFFVAWWPHVPPRQSGSWIAGDREMLEEPKPKHLHSVK